MGAATLCLVGVDVLWVCGNLPPYRHPSTTVVTGTQLRRDLAPRHPRFAQSYRLMAPEHAPGPPQLLPIGPGRFDAGHHTLAGDLALQFGESWHDV
jgi:hypothetical protein